jgi:hypothetical protein
MPLLRLNILKFCAADSEVNQLKLIGDRQRWLHLANILSTEQISL